jgi:hypothetical protein
MAFRDQGGLRSRTPTPSNGPVHLNPAAHVAPDFPQSSPSEDVSLPTRSKTSAQPNQPQESLVRPSTLFQTSDPPDASTQQDSLIQRDYVHAVANRILEIGRGARGEHWECHTLTPSQWEEVQVLAKETFQEDKIRVDYDPDRKELVIRMPSREHDVTAPRAARLIVKSIHDHLGAQAAEVFEEPCGDILFQNKAKKCPDWGIYENASSYFPTTVLEVGYANKPTAELAADYMKLSGGLIRTVVAFNLLYGKDTVKQHSIVVHRLEKTAHHPASIQSTTHVLREYGKDGTYKSHDGSVHFSSSDFGIDANKTPFSIPYKEFLEVADRAEVVQNLPRPAIPNLEIRDSSQSTASSTEGGKQ